MHSGPEPLRRHIGCPSCGTSSDFTVRHLAPNTYEQDVPLTVVSCNRCGLVFLNPQYTEAAYMDFYSNRYYQDVPARTLEKSRAELGNAYLRHYQDAFSAFARELTASDRVLDVGSGHGTWLKLLFRFAGTLDPRKVTALEPSTEACATLRRRFPAIDVVQDVLPSAKLPKGRFDAVICGALIEHLTDPFEGLVEMNGLLAERGRLFLVTPSAEPRSFRYGMNRFFKFVHTTYFTTAALDSVLHKAGFEVLHCRVDPGNDFGILWCPTILLTAGKVRPVPATVRSLTDADTANAAATAELFAGRVHTRVESSRWQSLRLQLARAHYRLTMPRL
jgi:SAM-dependent methyltransferase